jgi:hypothetical protein
MLRPWPSWQNVLRRTTLTVVGLCLYVEELITAIHLLHSPTHEPLVFTLCLLLMSIYGVGLLRAWELLGVQRTGLLAWFNPLYELSQPLANTDQTESS